MESYVGHTVKEKVMRNDCKVLEMLTAVCTVMYNVIVMTNSLHWYG